MRSNRNKEPGRSLKLTCLVSGLLANKRMFCLPLRLGTENVERHDFKWKLSYIDSSIYFVFVCQSKYPWRITAARSYEKSSPKNPNTSHVGFTNNAGGQVQPNREHECNCCVWTVLNKPHRGRKEEFTRINISPLGCLHNARAV